MISAKRVYEKPEPSDGSRVLIDRLWPRGLTAERARVTRWERDLAPSNELRKWFGHEPSRFGRFRERYRVELSRREDLLATLAREAHDGTVTLVYAARDSDHCNAVVLKELIDERLVSSPRARRFGRSRHRPAHG